MLSNTMRTAWGIICGIGVVVAFLLPQIWPFISLAILFTILYLLSKLIDGQNKLWVKLWEIEARMPERRRDHEPLVKDWLKEPPQLD
jgi:uncharacterized membrane protein